MTDDLGQEERDHLKANIAWLESADPDDWHRVALDFNWSGPLYVLDWIVRQPDCDVATALTLFWKGEAAFWFEEEPSEPEAPNGYSYINKLICTYVAKRVAAGGYSRSKIAFVPDGLWKADYVEMAAEEKRLAKPNFPIHPDLFANGVVAMWRMMGHFMRATPRIFTTLMMWATFPIRRSPSH